MWALAQVKQEKRWVEVATPKQAVVFRHYDGMNPSWQYHSMPASIVGGASTLEAARDDYREALRFFLDTDALPKIAEYVEHEVSHFGVWIRLPLNEPNRRTVLKEVTAQLRPEDQDWFAAHPTAGGDPVVLPGDPDQTISSVLDQITPYDSLILMMLHQGTEGRQAVWLVISGNVATHDNDQPLTSFESLGLTPESPLRELATVAVEQHLSELTVA
jgi:hypothetical protein